MNKYYMDSEKPVPAEPVESNEPSDAEDAEDDLDETSNTEEPAAVDGDFEPEVA